MPSHERVQELAKFVEQRRFLEAFAEFYHEDVAMQENSDEPRVGLAACTEHEARFLSTVETFHEISARTVLVDGEQAAIRWIFKATLIGGHTFQMDEIALQRWEGDKIISERFFYQTKPPA